MRGEQFPGLLRFKSLNLFFLRGRERLFFAESDLLFDFILILFRIKQIDIGKTEVHFVASGNDGILKDCAEDAA